MRAGVPRSLEACASYPSSAVTTNDGVDWCTLGYNPLLLYTGAQSYALANAFASAPSSQWPLDGKTGCSPVHSVVAKPWPLLLH